LGSAEGTYGWRHTEPSGINDRGWIVGAALNQDGDLRAFVLIPGRQRSEVAAIASEGDLPQNVGIELDRAGAARQQ
jgi:hypothetical protein